MLSTSVPSRWLASTEQGHAELMAALDGIAAGKGSTTLLRSRGSGRRPRFSMRCRASIQLFYEPFEPKDMGVVDRAYATLSETRRSDMKKRSCALDPRSSNRQTLNLGGTYLWLYRAMSSHDKGVAILRSSLDQRSLLNSQALRGLVSVHSRCGLHTRAVTNS